jgi:putative transposase
MSLTGVNFRAHPKAEQKKVLRQWMGCARFIWNAKCEENNYLYKFKQKFLPINTKTPIDQSYAQFKSPEFSPWLSDCPSQILRNTMCTWRETMGNFLKGNCGRPQKKKKSDGGSIWLTSELFKFDIGPNGKKRLFIGSKTNNIGYLDFIAHRDFSEPKSIRIKQQRGNFSVSFCYEIQAKNLDILNQSEHLKYLSQKSFTDLDAITIGVDRGLAIPAHTRSAHFDFSSEQKRHKNRATISIKSLQKKLNRQKNGSKQRFKTKNRISNKHAKIAHIRTDFAHKTSYQITSNKNIKVIVFEDLNNKELSKAPRAKTDANGRFVKNGASAKAGLNRAILDKSFGMIDRFCAYKAEAKGKAFFKISASYTSQECVDCGHTHPNNRLSQALFLCESCGHADNADKNAALVIKKRAIKLILDSGTESSYGFRFGRNAHQAVLKALEYQQQGHVYTVDIDLEKFFDNVNHDRLMYKLSQKIKDREILRLIRRFLQAGMMSDGLFLQRDKGTPQGSPLSPLLSNVVLDELDKELEQRGHKFCRYADDCNIYVKTQRSGERVFDSITKFIESTLKLRVNREKSSVVANFRSSFLGHKSPRIRCSNECIARFKHWVRQITRGHHSHQPIRERIQKLNEYVSGWYGYFRLSTTRNKFLDLDGWIRSRLRMCMFKQWRKPRTRVRMMLRLGLPIEQAKGYGQSKRYWHLAQLYWTRIAMNNELWRKLGFRSLEWNMDRFVKSN